MYGSRPFFKEGPGVVFYYAIGQFRTESPMMFVPPEAEVITGTKQSFAPARTTRQPVSLRLVRRYWFQPLSVCPSAWSRATPAVR